MLPESRRAHVRGLCQFVHSHLFGKVLPDPVRRLRNFLSWALCTNQVPKVRGVWTMQQTNQYFVLDQRRKLRNELRLIQQKK